MILPGTHPLISHTLHSSAGLPYSSVLPQLKAGPSSPAPSKEKEKLYSVKKILIMDLQDLQHIYSGFLRNY